MQPHLHARYLALRRRLAMRFMGGFEPYPPPPDGVSLDPSSAHDPLFDAAPLKLSWARAGIADPAAWQRAARDKLAELTGYRMADAVPEARFLSSADLPGGLVRHRSYLRVADGSDVPIDVVLPAAVSAPRPAMICLQGTNSGAHLSWGEARMPADPIKVANGNDYARQAVAHGYAAVCVEQSCFGERREQALPGPSADPCIDAANHALLLGRTLIGERASDVSAVIGWLAAGGAGAGVETGRVYAMGNSSGGTTAVYAAALDPRIGGVIAGGCVGPIRETLARRGNSSGQNIIPGILEWLEFADVLALIAPRPLLAISGDADHIWPFAKVERAVDGARAVYAAIGAENALGALRAQGGHRFYADLAWDGFRRLVDAAGA